MLVPFVSEIKTVYEGQSPFILLFTALTWVDRLDYKSSSFTTNHPIS